jgi:hypothetical protein
MENSPVYAQYQQNELMEKTAPQFDMLKILDNYKRSVDAYNSYGIKKKTDTTKETTSQQKKVLGERN